MIEGLCSCLPDLSAHVIQRLSDDYEIDDLALIPKLQTDNNIHAPRLEIELSPTQHDTFALAVNPFIYDQKSTWGNSYFKCKLWVSLLIFCTIKAKEDFFMFA